MCNFKSEMKSETPKTPFWSGVKPAPEPKIVPPVISLPVAATVKPVYVEPDMRGTVFTK